jgi:hypothetical protein
MKPEFLSAIGSVASAVVAALALYQIKVAKDAISAGSSSQQAAEAARQCERYIEHFLPLFRELDAALDESAFCPSSRSLKVYLNTPALINGDLDGLSKLMVQSNPLRAQILDSLNHLEIMSVGFVKAVASQDVAFQSLVFSYCVCADRLGVFALHTRREAACELLFSNLIRLYTDWEQEVSRELVQYIEKRYI